MKRFFSCIWVSGSSPKDQIKVKSKIPNAGIYDEPSIRIMRKISTASMSSDTTVFHTIDHIDAVTNFMQKALECFRIKILDDAMLGTRRTFNIIMISSAFMHDVCHPAGNLDKRSVIEQIASTCLDIIGDTMHRKSLEIQSYIEHTLTDVKTTKLEALHALVGVHYASGAITFTTYQKQFMMCMILATDLNSYHDIANMDTVMPTTKDIGKILMRCSDLSHFTMQWKDHLSWVKRLCKELCIDISPGNQVEFIDTYVLPQFKMLHCFLRCQESLDWISCIESNRSIWESMKV